MTVEGNIIIVYFLHVCISEVSVTLTSIHTVVRMTGIENYNSDGSIRVDINGVVVWKVSSFLGPFKICVC